MTNDSYCLEHNLIVLSAINKVVAHLAVRWNPYFSTPIPCLDLTVSLQAM